MKDCKPIKVMQESWDYLIILDACRYDYFEKVWRNYFSEGQLLCKHSVGSCTDEWRDKSFPDYYDDIVYITANPQINVSSRVFGYLASEHFKSIHEIWRESWDERSGTVLPDVVSRRARDIILQYPPNMRYIIHYLQPHAPYLSVTYSRKSKTLQEFNQFLIDPDKENSPMTIRLRLFRFLLPLFKKNRFLTNHPEWLLRKYLGISPKGPMEIAWRELGIKGLRKAYQENLEIALRSVASLVDQLSGTIIITSDHGDLLGEDRQFAHPKGSQHPTLRQVPWLVIKKEKKINFHNVSDKMIVPMSSKNTDTINKDDKNHQDQTVIERLRALGYY